MHRLLFHIGPVTVYSYGFMLALAFISGALLAEYRARRAGIGKDKIIDLTFYILVSSIAGARLLFVILNWDYYKQTPGDILKIWEGGLVFYGGLISGFITALCFLKAHKISVWLAADVLSAPLALGIAIGRIGCFLNGCCYGVISQQWGVCFPSTDNPPVFAQQLRDGLIPPGSLHSLPVIPSQLYSSAACLIIFFVLLFAEKRKKFDGFSFWLFILLYSVTRFIIEGFRYYESNFLFFGTLTVSQIISIALGVVASGFLVYPAVKSRTGKKNL
ncbi:MAG: prolipoprotein diacylglyceryl transferase [Candidatus Omnitrophica bacterium]|nr:prolipoprotein diacylglyceryl transferase [Candidatus Omnitrophota bacterium]